MKIGVYAAHEDDSILGVGGKILQHIKNGDEVYAVIFTDGRTSHKAVLGIEQNPTMEEVGTKRKKEAQKAMDILGVDQEKLYFLDLPREEGRVWQNPEEAYKQALEITKQEKPDIVYFHYPDAHRDHRAVSKVVLKVITDLESKPKAYQFFIWTKELAKGRPEVNEKDVPEIPKDAKRVDIRDELDTKRRALYKMRSQVLNWPYREWQIQKMPILDKTFIDFFLRGEEILIEKMLNNRR